MNSPTKALKAVISANNWAEAQDIAKAAIPVAELHEEMEGILRPILAEITTNPGLVAYFDLRLIKRAETALKELKALK